MSLGTLGSFSMHSGDSRVLELTVFAADGVTPADVTGASTIFSMSAKAHGQIAPSGIAVATMVGAVTDGPNGRIDFTLAPATTASLAGVYYFEIQMVLGGATSTVAYGTVTILADLIE